MKPRIEGENLVVGPLRARALGMGRKSILDPRPVHVEAAIVASTLEDRLARAATYQQIMHPLADARWQGTPVLLFNEKADPDSYRTATQESARLCDVGHAILEVARAEGNNADWALDIGNALRSHARDVSLGPRPSVSQESEQ